MFMDGHSDIFVFWTFLMQKFHRVRVLIIYSKQFLITIMDVRPDR